MDSAAIQSRLDALTAETDKLKSLLSTKRALEADAEPMELDCALATGRGSDAGATKRSRRGGSGTNNRRGGRPTMGAARTAGAESDAEADGRRGRSLWVKATDEARTVARLVSGAAEDDAVVGFPVTLHAKHEASFYVALKGVAVAIGACDRNSATPLACSIVFRESRDELTVTVVPLARAPPVADEDNHLSIASQTKFSALAGAIAGRVRSGEAAVVRVRGGAAAYTAGRALAVAAEYLAEDDAPSGIVAVPRFNKVQYEGYSDLTSVVDIAVFPCDHPP